MSVSYSAVLVYGVRVPDNHPSVAAVEDVDEHLSFILQEHPAVTFTQAGPYDRWPVHLVTDRYEVDTYAEGDDAILRIPPATNAEMIDRDIALHNACRAIGFPAHPEPSWFLIMDAG